MDPAKLAAVRKIVVHGDCPDGVASAILLHDAIPKAEVVFVKHSSTEYTSLPAEPGLLFCDISPPADRVAEFVAAGSLVLDHHRTAREVVEQFGADGVFGDEVADPGVCGAVLAYERVWFQKFRGRAPEDVISRAHHFAWRAGVRDTWQRQHQDWRAACEQAEALLFYPAESWLVTSSPVYMPFSGYWLDSRLAVGAVIIDKQEQSLRRTIAEAYRFATPSGTKVIIFEGLHATSDAAELLGAEVDLVVGFSHRCEDNIPRIDFSTRSHTTFDCAAFCKSRDGGGHTRAAGFNAVIDASDDSSPNVYAMFRSIVSKWDQP